MKTYKVDLDYESYLFQSNYQEKDLSNHKIIKEFEYVFFLINKSQCNLKNLKNYSPNYLKKLEDLGFIIPSLKPDELNYEFWWGYRHNKEIEILLNSKITSSSIAQKNNWGFYHGKIVTNIDEINNHIKNFEFENWILKSPYSFSGIGHNVFNRNFLPLVQMRGEYLLEPLYERVCDIGTTFEILDGKIQNMFIVENINNSKGSFKGGVAAKNVSLFIEYFFKKYNFDLSTSIPIFEKICEEYLRLGAINNIQIDSFIYRDKNSLKLYPLVEVNYRKTMGLVLSSLVQHFNTDLIEWRVTHTSDYKNNSEWIELSPEGNKLQSYLKLRMI